MTHSLLASPARLLLQADPCRRLQQQPQAPQLVAQQQMHPVQHWQVLLVLLLSCCRLYWQQQHSGQLLRVQHQQLSQPLLHLQQLLVALLL